MKEFVKKNKKWLIIGGIVVIVLIIFIKVTSPKSLQVNGYTIDKGAVLKTVEEKGTVVGEKESYIYSTIMGSVAEINVKEGDLINAGDIIASIGSTDINYDILSYQARLDSIVAQYEKAKKPASKEEIKGATATLNTAKLQYEKAEKNYQNYKVLYENNAISKSTFEEIELAKNIAYENMMIAESGLDMLTRGITNEDRRMFESQISEIRHTINKLSSNLDKHLIRTSFGGIVTNVFVKEGEVVNPGSQIVEVVNTENILIYLEILAEDVFKVNNDVIVEDKDLGVKLNGKVTKIYPKAYTKLSDLGIEQKRVKVEVKLLEISEKIMLGFNMDVSIISDKRDSVRVPKEAVFEMENENYVFIVKNNKAKLTKVNLGLSGEDYIEVLKGLEVNDIVILTPSNDLEDNMKVLVKVESGK